MQDAQRIVNHYPYPVPTMLFKFGVPYMYMDGPSDALRQACASTHRAYPGSEFDVANTLNKCKKLEPN